MNKMFKPCLPGTIEKYSYEVQYTVNGGIFYMNVIAENEEEAIKEVKEQYFKNEEIEIVKVI